MSTVNQDDAGQNTHILETRRQMGVSGQQTQMGEDALPRDEERKGGLSTANTDDGGQKHTPATDDKTMRGLRTANADRGGQKHTLSRDQETEGGSEDSKHRWVRTKAHTN